MRLSIQYACGMSEQLSQSFGMGFNQLTERCCDEEFY